MRVIVLDYRRHGIKPNDPEGIPSSSKESSVGPVSYYLGPGHS